MKIEKGVLISVTENDIINGSFIVPKTIHEIGTHAFFGIDGLEEVKITGNVKVIKDSAFSYCSNLQSVKIEEGVEILEGWIFQACENLKEVNLPKTLISIGEFTFCDCKKLECLHIPNSVQRVGDGIFDSCESLKEIWMTEVIDMRLEHFDKNTNQNCIIHHCGKTQILKNIKDYF